MLSSCPISHWVCRDCSGSWRCSKVSGSNLNFSESLKSFPCALQEGSSFLRIRLFWCMGPFSCFSHRRCVQYTPTLHNFYSDVSVRLWIPFGEGFSRKKRAIFEIFAIPYFRKYRMALLCFIIPSVRKIMPEYAWKLLLFCISAFLYNSIIPFYHSIIPILWVNHQSCVPELREFLLWV